MTPQELRTLRKMLDLTQEAAAALFGVTVRGYAKWERGEAPIDLRTVRVAEYALSLRKELERLRSDLAPLEAGEMRLGVRHTGGDWVDTTAERIAQLRRSIAETEATLREFLTTRRGSEGKLLGKNP